MVRKQNERTLILQYWIIPLSLPTKTLFLLPKWGGYPFSYALRTSSGLLLSSPFPAFIVANFQTTRANFQQKGAKVNFFLPAFVFSRDFRRPKGAKFKIYLIFEDCGASVVALTLWRWWCPLVAGGRGTLAILLTLAKMDKNPSFRPFAAFAFLQYLQICPYLAF